MKLVEMKVTDFVNELAGDSAVPGGGSVAALAGSVAAGLVAMVARLTIGRKKYEDVREAMAQVRDEADRLADVFCDLVDRDAEAYKGVVDAFKMPRKTDDDKKARCAAIQGATKQAAIVPLKTLKALAQITDLAEEIIHKGNSNCLTDVGTAVQMARAGALGAAYNVRINLGSIKDQGAVAKLRQETDTLITKVLKSAQSMEAMIEAGLGDPL